MTLVEPTTIEIVAQGAEDEPDLEALADLMNAVASIWSWGACPAPGLGPGETPTVMLMRPSTTSDEYRQSVRVRGLHQAAYNMLLTLLAQRHYGAFPLKAATVHGSGEGDVLSLDEILGGGFPSSPVPLPFETQIPDDVLTLDEMVFRVRFASDNVSPELPKIQARITEWSNLTALGAYLDTFEETDDLAIYPREAVDRFADTIELWIRAVSLNRAAIDGLLNILCRVHWLVSPIAVLEIE